MIDRKQFLTRFAACVAACSALLAAGQTEALTPAQRLVIGSKGPPTPFIYDDDFSTYPDGELPMAVAIHLSGRGNLIACNIDTKDQYAAQAVRACLAHVGLTNIPIWQYAGAENPGPPGQFNPALASLFGTYSSSTINSVAGFRKALAAAQPNSVVIFMSGFATSVAAAMASSADATSPLTGLQLFAQKVKRCYWEAGWFPSNSAPQNSYGAQPPEYNVSTTVADSQYLIANWPANVPLIWCGNDQLFNGAVPPNAVPTFSLYLMQWSIFGKALTYSRDVYGPPCYLMEFYPQQAASIWYLGGKNGTVAVDGSGNDAWSSTPGPHSYISTINYVDLPHYSVRANALFSTIGFPMLQGASPDQSTADFTGISIAWWDASLSTISGSGAGTTISDLSGNGNAMTVAPEGSVCSVTASDSTLNNLKTLGFNGTNQAMACDSVAVALSGAATAFHVFAVVKINGSTSDQQNILDLGPTPGSAVHFLNRILAADFFGTPGFGAARAVADADGSLYPRGALMTVGTWAIIDFWYDPTKPNGFRQGSSWNEVGPYVSGDSDDNASLTLVAGRIMGASVSSNLPTRRFWCNGQLYMMAICNQVLYGNEYMKRIRYLANRTGISVPL